LSKPTIPPYKDFLLVSRRGEIWDDIPGFEGYFRISNFGRIKRMEREIVYSNGRIHLLKEKILAPRLQRSPNQTMQDHTHQLTAHLALDGKRFHLPISRLVYNCFMSPFALDDWKIIVVSRNGNGLDIRPRNLLLIPRDTKTKRIYK